MIAFFPVHYNTRSCEHNVWSARCDPQYLHNAWKRSIKKGLTDKGKYPNFHVVDDRPDNEICHRCLFCEHNFHHWLGYGAPSDWHIAPIQGPAILYKDALSPIRRRRRIVLLVTSG
jgi:hypothetical protein